jgi:hypothetical protein
MRRGVAAPITKDLKCLLQTFSGVPDHLEGVDHGCNRDRNCRALGGYGPVGDERVEHEGDEVVKVFVPSDETGDDVADAQVVALMSQFLLTRLGKEKEGEEPPLKEVRRLLKKGPRGLSQVIGIERKSVKPPPPSTDQ